MIAVIFSRTLLAAAAILTQLITAGALAALTAGMIVPFGTVTANIVFLTVSIAQCAIRAQSAIPAFFIYRAITTAIAEMLGIFVAFYAIIMLTALVIGIFPAALLA